MVSPLSIRPSGRIRYQLIILIPNKQAGFFIVAEIYSSAIFIGDIFAFIVDNSFNHSYRCWVQGRFCTADFSNHGFDFGNVAYSNILLLKDKSQRLNENDAFQASGIERACFS